jgi:transcriptional regulator with XRE-family HTH domain
VDVSIDTDAWYLGGVLREFRRSFGLTQQQAGEGMGFPTATAQSSYSRREARPDNRNYIAVTIPEIVRLEDSVDAERGTILRAAGLVVCPDVDTEPADLVRSWLWLNESERSVITTLMQAALARRASEADPGPAKRRKKIR